MNQTYTSNGASVRIFQETSGFDIRLRFIHGDRDDISFEFPTSGNISPKTFWALYDILTETQRDISHIVP